MKELRSYVFSLNVKALFITPSTNGWVQIFRYLFVGGIAFVADSGSLWCFYTLLGLHYLLATAVAFLFGLITNFVLAKAFVFKANTARCNVVAEFISYALIGLLGLALTMLLMYLGVDLLGLPVMVTKCIAVVIVLVWNYAARKLLIYKEVDDA